MSWNAPIPSETLHRTLTRALGAAQVAVKLDASNHDTNATVAAYQRCIALLDDVVRREPSEEEVGRLKAIVYSGHLIEIGFKFCYSVAAFR
ncbi:hypothetical protein B0H17DRAFT_1332456 [Mycena rosella]|uniref:Uncharacterized protein n=1 Tax=Mycena rosella TaxID=1033263 RepID=A0AAD7DCT4_MYCRO|nr:hypothetical protein B0H17DRAFT_1332456 [Mycena rosella]